MAFQIPEGLHEDLYPLAWLIGTWSGSGKGEYEGIENFNFMHEVTFNHDGRKFLTYYSRSWLVDDNNEIIKPSASETGFWTINEGNKLEVMLAHSNGHAEGWLGVVDGARIQLAMDQAYSSPTAKVVEGGHRLYGLVEGDLFFAYDMAAQGKSLQPHIWSTMARVNV